MQTSTSLRHDDDANDFYVKIKLTRTKKWKNIHEIYCDSGTNWAETRSNNDCDLQAMKTWLNAFKYGVAIAVK